ncbi:ethanolamine permease [Pigmentibacter sp. JX0631]|uniref:ethanolamine permease n=1 Tax=Pigmentibacter sp. JX0631 TaxID=2976982 RepID=UPI0024698E58|nr:ethanolamine permease [Pigmentibacter sp. JX0631]WGL61475.1 ethanolamine permease [Pigmentibacter sp. JX0631]
MDIKDNKLKPVLGTFQLWGIAVGLVISGEYFGWSYGWGSAGTLGFLVTFFLISSLYFTFIFSFTELSTAIPHAGGPFAYAKRAFGPIGGYIAGFATLVEFLFAPPAIALAIGAYLNVQFPSLDPKWIACFCYFIFTILNILGVSIAASFELVVTIFAIIELLIFMGVVLPGFKLENFISHGWAGSDHFSITSISGILAAIPFAIWFFLAIEGAAMAAEEVKNPRKTIPRAFISGIMTLIILALGVMIFAGGVGDWRKFANINDPLPEAMKVIVGNSSGWLHMLVWLGLFGLIASFHGIIMGYSRQIFALSREGYLPSFLAKIHPTFKTPYIAIFIGSIFGILVIFSDNIIKIQGQTLSASIVTMSVFGAIIMYIISMMSLLKLRKKEPELERPFQAPFYPYFPIIALILSIISLISMLYFNLYLGVIFFILCIVCGFYSLFFYKRRLKFENSKEVQLN